MKKIYFLLSALLISTLTYAQSITSTLTGTAGNVTMTTSNPWYPNNTTSIAQGDALNFAGAFDVSYGAVSDIQIKLMELNASWATVNSYLAVHSINLTSGTYNVDFPVPAHAPNSVNLPTGNFYLYQVRINYADLTTKFVNARVKIDGTYIPLAIESLETIDAVVYPNPVSKGSQLTVDATAFSSEVTIEIYNVAGSKVYTTTSEPVKVPVDSSLLSSGLYTVVVSSAENVAIYKSDCKINHQLSIFRKQSMFYTSLLFYLQQRYILK